MEDNLFVQRPQRRVLLAHAREMLAVRGPDAGDLRCGICSFLRAQTRGAQPVDELFVQLPQVVIVRLNFFQLPPARRREHGFVEHQGLARRSRELLVFLGADGRAGSSNGVGGRVAGRAQRAGLGHGLGRGSHAAETRLYRGS